MRNSFYTRILALATWLLSARISASMMHIIANPASANGATGLRWSGIEAHLRAEGLKFDVSLTDAPGHATDLVKKAVESGANTVVCAGGDGTLNEVVNGLMAIDESRRPALAIIPCGTGTDFARGLNLPRDLDRIAGTLKTRHTKGIDVGVVSFVRAGQALSRHFINIAGLGFDGEVSDVVNQQGKRGGSAAYFLTVFKVLAGYVNKRARVTLVAPDDTERVIDDAFNLIAVSNGRYFGGGMLVSPHSDPFDGLFDVIVIKAMGRGEFAMNFPKVYRGTHLSHPKVSEYRAREVRVDLLPHPNAPHPGPLPQGEGEKTRMFLEAEGELFGEAPAHFRILPSALRLVIGD
jgi:YegS/Rv2252/BmrU family lipid kinase